MGSGDAALWESDLAVISAWGVGWEEVAGRRASVLVFFEERIQQRDRDCETDHNLSTCGKAHRQTQE